MRYNKFMEGKNLNLKPQDVIVILKVLSKGKVPWRISDLAYELDLSAGEVSNCLGRLKACALISNDKKTPMVTNLKEFLLYGLRYTFPARLGKNERGVLTAHSFGPISKKIVSDVNYVWPFPDGEVKGVSVSPLFKNAPKASLNDEKLHQFLALIDSVRIGKVREKKLAMEALEKELSSYEL
tara:strand:+ start:3948 stop:4493 length:546 start_codon:yes stop_codon:yes gene_type:complete